MSVLEFPKRGGLEGSGGVEQLAQFHPMYRPRSLGRANGIAVKENSSPAKGAGIGRSLVPVLLPAKQFGFDRGGESKYGGGRRAVCSPANHSLWLEQNTRIKS